MVKLLKTKELSMHLNNTKRKYFQEGKHFLAQIDLNQHFYVSNLNSILSTETFN